MCVTKARFAKKVDAKMAVMKTLAAPMARFVKQANVQILCAPMRSLVLVGRFAKAVDVLLAQRKPTVVLAKYATTVAV